MCKTNKIRTKHPWLRKARERRGLQQKQLAALVGCTPTTVYNWERGYTHVQQRYRRALAAALGVKRTAFGKLKQQRGMKEDEVEK